MSQRYVNLSSIAVAKTGSPKNSAHSSKALFDVMIIEVCSCRSDINLKNRLASVRSMGRYPTSSIIKRADLYILFNFVLLLKVTSLVLSVCIRELIVTKLTWYPSSAALYPKAIPKCVLPTPGGPNSIRL